MLSYRPSTCIWRLRLPNCFVDLKPFSSPAYSVHLSFNPLIFKLLTDQIQTHVYLFRAFLISLGPFPPRQQPPRQLPQLGLERSHIMSSPSPVLSSAEERACLRKSLLHFLSGLAQPLVAQWGLLSSSRTHSHKVPSLLLRITSVRKFKSILFKSWV